MGGAPQLWVFDCEWVPDLRAGRLLYHYDNDTPDSVVMERMWQEAGATPENPQPFLKTILSRVVSIAMVVRIESPDPNARPKLALCSVPSLNDQLGVNPNQYPTEHNLLQLFLQSYEKHHPTLAGYNSRNADLHILRQRAIVNGLQSPAFATELAAKPWNATAIDLMDMVGKPGKGYTASLNEVATLSGFPGKIETTGYDVARMYYSGRLREIVEYNMFDAITTYLLYLRLEYFKGNFTPERYAQEQQWLRELVQTECAKPNGEYLNLYLHEWNRLQTIH